MGAWYRLPSGLPFYVSGRRPVAPAGAEPIDDPPAAVLEQPVEGLEGGDPAAVEHPVGDDAAQLEQLADSEVEHDDSVAGG